MPSSDRPHIDESGIDLPAAAGSASSLLSCASRARPAKKRLKIWQIPSGWLCSVVGTCLTPADVERIVRRCGVTLPDDAQAYDVHGYLVGRAAEQGRVAREISKTLDEKHAAILRKVGAEPDQARLAALWNDLCSRGLVAGAYWAIMSHAPRSRRAQDARVRRGPYAVPLHGRLQSAQCQGALDPTAPSR